MVRADEEIQAQVPIAIVVAFVLKDCGPSRIRQTIETPRTIRPYARQRGDADIVSIDVYGQLALTHGDHRPLEFLWPE
jgi:hypothetical protein